MRDVLLDRCQTRFLTFPKVLLRYNARQGVVHRLISSSSSFSSSFPSREVRDNLLENDQKLVSEKQRQKTSDVEGAEDDAIVSLESKSSQDPVQQRLTGLFVRPQPVISYERIHQCPTCNGSRLVDCSACKGSGRLPVGGYQSRTPIDVKRIIGSKWTAMQRTMGWRHFRVTQKRKHGKHTFVQLTATCDESCSVYVNLAILKDRELWAAGWLQRRQLEELENQSAGKLCKVCSGNGTVDCPLCALSGKITEI